MLSFSIFFVCILKLSFGQFIGGTCDYEPTMACIDVLTASSQDCPAIMDYVACIADSCPLTFELYAEAWESVISSCSLECKTEPVEVQTCKIFGDPHIVPFAGDGSFYTCNDKGADLIAHQDEFTQVVLSTEATQGFPNPSVSVVTGVKVINLLTGMEFNWPFTPYEANGIKVTANTYVDECSGAAVNVAGLWSIIIVGKSSEVGWCSEHSCELIDDSFRRAIPTHEECDGLIEPYKSTCNFDIESSGTSNFTAISSDMQYATFNPFTEIEESAGSEYVVNMFLFSAIAVFLHIF